MIPSLFQNFPNWKDLIQKQYCRRLMMHGRSSQKHPWQNNVNFAVNTGLLVPNKGWPSVSPEPAANNRWEPLRSGSRKSSLTSTITTTRTLDASGSNPGCRHKSISVTTFVVLILVNLWLLRIACCRCQVPGMYYFVYHASLDSRLCILMKMDNRLLASFCDYRGIKRQVPTIWKTTLTNTVVWIFGIEMKKNTEYRVPLAHCKTIKQTKTYHIWNDNWNSVVKSQLNIYFICFVHCCLKSDLCCLITGDFRWSGSLPVQRPGSLVGNQRLQRNDRKTDWLQHLLWLPDARPLAA